MDFEKKRELISLGMFEFSQHPELLVRLFSREEHSRIWEKNLTAYYYLCLYVGRNYICPQTTLSFVNRLAMARRLIDSMGLTGVPLGFYTEGSELSESNGAAILCDMSIDPTAASSLSIISLKYLKTMTEFEFAVIAAHEGIHSILHEGGLELLTAATPLTRKWAKEHHISYRASSSILYYEKGREYERLPKMNPEERQLKLEEECLAYAFEDWVRNYYISVDEKTGELAFNEKALVVKEDTPEDHKLFIRILKREFAQNPPTT